MLSPAGTYLTGQPHTLKRATLMQRLGVGFMQRRAVRRTVRPRNVARHAEPTVLVPTVSGSTLP